MTFLFEVLENFGIFWNVRLKYAINCCILWNIESEYKQSVLPPLTFWCMQNYSTTYVVRLIDGGGWFGRNDFIKNYISTILRISSSYHYKLYLVNHHLLFTTQAKNKKTFCFWPRECFLTFLWQHILCLLTFYFYYKRFYIICQISLGVI